jgi:hypothetical protein
VAKRLKTVRKGAFYNCHQLRQVIADGIEEICDEGFIGCVSLVNFDF